MFEDKLIDEAEVIEIRKEVTDVLQRDKQTHTIRRSSRTNLLKQQKL